LDHQNNYVERSSWLLGR